MTKSCNFNNDDKELLQTWMLVTLTVEKDFIFCNTVKDNGFILTNMDIYITDI